MPSLLTVSHRDVSWRGVVLSRSLRLVASFVARRAALWRSATRARGTLSALIALSIAVCRAGATDGRQPRRRLFALSAADLSRATGAAKSGARSGGAGRVTGAPRLCCDRTGAARPAEARADNGRRRRAGGGRFARRSEDRVHADQADDVRGAR